MVTAETTPCSTGIGSQKENKNWREICKYLQSRVDRTRILRKVGNVLVCNLEALRQEKEQGIVGQRQKQGVSVGYCSCGVAYPPWDQRGGDRMARRQKQRAKRGHLRDDCTVLRVLAQSLNPL